MGCWTAGLALSGGRSDNPKSTWESIWEPYGNAGMPLVGKKDMALKSAKSLHCRCLCIILRRSSVKHPNLPRSRWPGHYPWASPHPTNSSKRVEPQTTSVQIQPVMIKFQWLGQKNVRIVKQNHQRSIHASVGVWHLCTYKLLTLYLSCT